MVLVKEFDYQNCKESILSNSMSITRFILSTERLHKYGFSEAIGKVNLDRLKQFKSLGEYDDIKAAFLLNITRLANQKDVTGTTPASLHPIRSALTYSFVTEKYSNLDLSERKATVLNILLHDFLQQPTWNHDLKNINEHLENKIDPKKLIVREPILDYTNQKEEEIFIIQSFAYILLARQSNSSIFYNGLISDIIDTLLGPILYPNYYTREHIFPMLVNFYFMVNSIKSHSELSVHLMCENIFNDIKDIYSITDEEIEKNLNQIELKSTYYKPIASELLSDWKKRTNYPI